MHRAYICRLVSCVANAAGLGIRSVNGSLCACEQPTILFHMRLCQVTVVAGGADRRSTTDI